MPYEKLLGAPASAVVGIIAVMAVAALALALKQLLQGRKNGNGNGHAWDESRVAILEREVEKLRVAKHDHATKISEALLLAHRAERRLNRIRQSEP